MASQTLNVKRTHLKGKPPILADESVAVDWAITQGVSQATAQNLFDAVATLRGREWRVYFIREVARSTCK